MAKSKNKKGMSKAGMVAVGAGLAAVGAGAYYLMGPEAKKHQKKAKDLMAKMKKQVASKVKKAKVVTAPLYNSAVDAVSAEYAKQYKAHEAEIKAFARNMKGQWKDMANKVVKKSVQKAKSAAKKVVSKAKSKGKKRR
jgi:hypothetical protein